MKKSIQARLIPSLFCLLPLTGALAASPVMPGDETLDCAAIAGQQRELGETIAAGDPNAPNMGKAAAGTAANVGSAIVTQASGLFGALGNLAGKIAGGVAQQQVEEKMGPDAAAQQAAAEASSRSQFLGQLADAKACDPDKPDFTGKALSAEAFKALAAGPAGGEVHPMTASSVQQTLAEPIAPLAAGLALDGDLKLDGKTFYIGEFRILFEVGGEVSAHTRAGYMPGGTHYGATNSRIKYKVAQPDIAALQLLTDQAWKNLKEQLAARGIAPEDPAGFIAAHGEVYPATEAASTPQAPVYIEENLGHTVRKYLVMAPTGMKLHSRGLAGLGIGNIGSRIDWVKNRYEGLSIGIAINIAGLETSGSGSSILHREGANTATGEKMMLAIPAGSFVAQTHADVTALRLGKPLAIPGSFARFRTVGGYDTQKDAAVRALQIAGNLAGVAANKSRTVEMEVDLDGPATSRMAMQGLATFNQALAASLRKM